MSGYHTEFSTSFFPARPSLKLPVMSSMSCLRIMPDGADWYRARARKLEQERKRKWEEYFSEISDAEDDDVTVVGGARAGQRASAIPHSQPTAKPILTRYDGIVLMPDDAEWKRGRAARGEEEMHERSSGRHRSRISPASEDEKPRIHRHRRPYHRANGHPRYQRHVSSPSSSESPDIKPRIRNARPKTEDKDMLACPSDEDEKIHPRSYSGGRCLQLNPVLSAKYDFVKRLTGPVRTIRLGHGRRRFLKPCWRCYALGKPCVKTGKGNRGCDQCALDLGYCNAGGRIPGYLREDRMKSYLDRALENLQKGGEYIPPIAQPLEPNPLRPGIKRQKATWKKEEEEQKPSVNGGLAARALYAVRQLAKSFTDSSTAGRGNTTDRNTGQPARSDPLLIEWRPLNIPTSSGTQTATSHPPQGPQTPQADVSTRSSYGTAESTFENILQSADSLLDLLERSGSVGQPQSLALESFRKISLERGETAQAIDATIKLVSLLLPSAASPTVLQRVLREVRLALHDSVTNDSEGGSSSAAASSSSQGTLFL